MKKVKEFCKENKKEIITTACVIGLAIIGVNVLTKKNVITDYGDLGGILYRPSDNKIIGLEEAKAILELNANNSTKYAIFREGGNPNDYMCIELSKRTIDTYVEFGKIH